VFTKIAKELIKHESEKYQKANSDVLKSIQTLKTNSDLTSEKGQKEFQSLQKQEQNTYQKRLTVSEVEKQVNFILVDKSEKSQPNSTAKQLRELQKAGYDTRSIKNKKEMNDLVKKMENEITRSSEKEKEIKEKEERSRDSKSRGKEEFEMEL
jgi:hypothetical protein